MSRQPARSQLPAVIEPPKDLRPKTEDVTMTNDANADFEGFYLKHELRLALHAMGFERPSPIQEAAIPKAMAGNHVLARAKNGTGKTAAYLIPCLERVDVGISAIQILILVPTRELALQVADESKKLGRFLVPETTSASAPKPTDSATPHLRVMASFGGIPVHDDVLRLQQPNTPHIVVATPARIHDFCMKKAADLSRCSVVVLDEADKLLSQDFLPVVTRLLKAGWLPAPEQRQLLLFSATYPASVMSFRDEFMEASRRSEINLMSELTLRGITQYYAFVSEQNKVACLMSLFRKLKVNQCIIFCNSIQRVELLARRMHAAKLRTLYIHAKMNQDHRNRVFHDFRSGKVRFLVSSDVFARGIDVQTVNVVVNFDFPRQGETYLHRIGRSGRFGHYGIAVNFVTYDDRLALFQIERELGTEIVALPESVPDDLYASCGQDDAVGVPQ